MALVLLNPFAGSGRAGRLEAAMQDWLRRHHPQVAFAAPRTVGEAQRRVREAPRGSRVVVAGGDGSVHALLRPVLDGQHELAIVPAGGGDDGARALGLHGLAWTRALSRALLTEARPADIGWVSTADDERPFLSSLNAGFDAAVAQRAIAGPNWLRGLPRYLLATAREVAALRLHTMRIVADGQAVHEGPALFASSLNSATYGGGMQAMPMARLDDGQLNLLLAGRFGRLGVLAMLPRLLLGRHLGHPRVKHLAFAKLQIEADQPLPLAADGEPMPDSRQLVVRVGQSVLRVVPGALTPQLGQRV